LLTVLATRLFDRNQRDANAATVANDKGGVQFVRQGALCLIGIVLNDGRRRIFVLALASFLPRIFQHGGCSWRAVTSSPTGLRTFPTKRNGTWINCQGSDRRRKALRRFGIARPTLDIRPCQSVLLVHAPTTRKPIRRASKEKNYWRVKSAKLASFHVQKSNLAAPTLMGPLTNTSAWLLEARAAKMGYPV